MCGKRSSSHSKHSCFKTPKLSLVAKPFITSSPSTHLPSPVPVTSPTFTKKTLFQPTMKPQPPTSLTESSQRLAQQRKLVQLMSVEELRDKLLSLRNSQHKSQSTGLKKSGKTNLRLLVLSSK